MNSRSNRRPYLGVQLLLAYFVLTGLVPVFSDVLSIGRGVNVHHNFELAWGLMHMGPALVGVVLALWYVRDLPIYSGVAIVCLTLQILFPLLDYRRIGFDPRMEAGLSVSKYLTTMLLLGIPFAGVFLALKMRERRPSSYYSR